MSHYRALLTLSTLAMSFGVSSAAKASNDVALSFELSPSPQAAAEAAEAEAAAAQIAAEAAAAQALAQSEAPLPIPAGAENPPMASDNSRPSGVYGGLEAVAIGSTASVQALLPEPPPIPAYVQAIQTAIAPQPDPTPEESAQALSAIKTREKIALFIGVQDKTFEPSIPDNAVAVDPASAQAEPTIFEYSFDNFHTLFTGGTESLVARAVGSAEGTRTPEGHKNPAYYGHSDPGNGVWNLGTFSYQHGAASPEEADDKQLRRLKTQTETLRQKAHDQGLQLTQEEILNGIDLANQAPLAALDRGGYIDWLKEAHSLGMQGSEAIIWARTRSFIDPDTQRWNAPGLGNNIYSISHDQERRANVIARAITAFNTQTQVAIAPAPVPNNGDVAVELEPAIAAPAAIIDPVPFALDAFPGNETASSAVAQSPEPSADAATAPAISDNPESQVVAMTALNNDERNLPSSDSQPPVNRSEHQLKPRRLGRLGQAVTNFLSRAEADSVNSPEDSTAATQKIPAPAPAINSETPAAALKPLTLSDNWTYSDEPSEVVGRDAAASQLETQSNDAELPAAAIHDNSKATVTSPLQEAGDIANEADSTPSSAELENNSVVETAATPAEPSTISFETAPPPSVLVDDNTKTAPALETDAASMKASTLKSLDRLQSILQAEAEEAASHP